MLKPILALLVSFPLITAAQNGPGRQPDSAATARVRAWDRQHCAPKEGLRLPEFTGMTPEGTVFTLGQLEQRISLVMFWYPSCNCFRPEVIEPFMPFLSNPRFQIVSIMPDSFNYAAFIRECKVPGVHVNLSSNEKCYELNMNSGFPSAMLVDASGNVLKMTGSFHRFYVDESEWAARIREALLF